MPAKQKVSLTLRVNGAAFDVSVAPMARLLDVLRDELRLTGTKEGCGEGECGACSVLLGGELVNSCLIPALQATAEITTIEGIAALAPEGSSLHAVQQAFLDGGGAQCGICTPGMIVATCHLLSKNPDPSVAEMRAALAGNLCRCTGYTKILSSVAAAAASLKAQEAL